MSGVAKIRRAWVAAWPDSSGWPTDNVTLCIRVDVDSEQLEYQEMELRRSREDPEMERHLKLGLFKEDSLRVLADAIYNYLEGAS